MMDFIAFCVLLTCILTLVWAIHALCTALAEAEAALARLDAYDSAFPHERGPFDADLRGEI